MVAPRFFSSYRGTRKGGSGSVRDLIREQLRKDQKIDIVELNKKIIQNKIAESRNKAIRGENRNSQSLVGGRAAPPSATSAKSRRSENIINMLLQQEKKKAEKAARMAVTIEPKNFANGRIDKKGRIYDTAGNLVAKVNLKNGMITTNYGQHVGKYVARSYTTKIAIENAIHRNSPFLINQRKMLEMKRQEVINTPQTSNYWGEQKDIWGNPM